MLSICIYLLLLLSKKKKKKREIVPIYYIDNKYSIAASTLPPVANNARTLEDFSEKPISSN